MTSEELGVGLDISNPLLTIRYDELNSDGQAFLAANKQEFNMRNVKPVSSYNWQANSDQPTIIVPGMPKRLTKWSGGQLQFDTEEMFPIMKNDLTKNCPMQPMFVAVKVAAEKKKAPITDEDSQEFKFQNFDFATDRSNLQRLFEFLENKQYAEPIRVDVQLINNLICLIRVRKNDVQSGSAYNNYKTYGRNFERQMTEAQNELCSGSYRQVIGYDFGIFKILMRSRIHCADLEMSEPVQQAEKRKEVHEQICDLALVSKAKAEEKEKLAPSYENAGLEDEKDSMNSQAMNDFLDKVSISSRSDQTDDVINVISHGDWRCFHLMEIGCRRIYKKRQKAAFPVHVWKTLYFSQIPTFILGYQRFGKVDPNDFERYSFEQVEEKCGGFPLAQVARLHDLLGKIAKFVRLNCRQKDTIFSLFWEPLFGRQLKIFRVENPQRFAVSDELRASIADN